MSTGRGNGNGKKRHNSQPMEGANKDARQDEDLSWATVVNGSQNHARSTIPISNSFNLLATSDSYPDKTMRSGSITSRGSRGSRGYGGNRSSYAQPNRGGNRTNADSRREDRPADLGENTRFVTPEQSGPYRDEIVIECQKINDRPFKGTITFNEAADRIFVETLGFKFEDLYSVRMRYSGCPTVRFKLKEQTNIDDLRSVEHFMLERKAQNSNEVDYISCKIIGIRGMTSVPHYDGSENDIRWVKIEGHEYQLTEDELKMGLEPFGELLTPIREDIHVDSDSERESKGNGTYSVKMRIERPIPQFLPMHGRRIRVYHSGIDKLCTNCYGKHTRRQCRNHKTPWIEYVRDFMYRFKEIEENYYGKWWDIVDTEYPGYFDTDMNEVDNQREVPPQPEPPKTRFAEIRIPTSSQSRDPRINRQIHQAASSQSHTEPQASTSAHKDVHTQNYDRQTEMSRLLDSGLTLTDAKRYLDHKDELAAIEQRMRTSTRGRTSSQTSRGRGLVNH